MGCAALLVTREFAVALPDGSAVLGGGVPGFGAVIITAISANDMGGQNTLAAVASGKGSSAFDLCLDNGELLRLNNSWVAVFYIVLGNFTIIGDHLFCEEVDCVGFLKEGIPFILFISEDTLDGGW